MADYDLSRLSPRNFEHLIQALALGVVAPGVTVFGDGPDGGREASFEGSVNFPSSTKPWSGFGIIQAKFRQESEGVSRDGQWAVEQLRKELASRTKTRRKLRRPKFYIFATNVTLSPSANSGAKDRVSEMLSTQGARLGIADHRIWDHDQICRYLDMYPEIRRTYSAWITPGDVLAIMLDNLRSSQRVDLTSAIDIFVEKQLLSDQCARLDTIWTEDDRQMPLAKVFVDLPARPQRTVLVPALPDLPDSASGFVARFLQWAHENQPPSDSKARQSISTRAASGRYALVGGPGQGKSTIGQFICQLFRAAILSARSDRISLDARRALSLLEAQAARTGLSIPLVRRLPIKVELRRLAASLASSQGSVRSLLGWIAHEVRITTDRDVEIDDIRRLITAWPTLLILDGLDEVPASSNRDIVLRTIRDFFIDISEIGADLIVLATTRPQGYNDDFTPELYEHWYLTPIPPARAKLYASLLFEQRHPADPPRQLELMHRIESALSSEHTARLMQSPLQVTIMATLVERVGQPPQNRWRLFREYYDTIYRREMERSIPTSVILRENQAVVDRLHYEVGFELQVSTEGRGGTEARMPLVQFESIARRFFSKAGWDEETIGIKVEAIRKAATERLVFLVAVNEGFVGFELRSLQEFMAAEHLSRGRDDDVRARVRTIAPAVHWRNVLRFACGRLLSEADHLLDGVCQLCQELNEESTDVVDSQVLTGSRIAVDLLEDGFAQEQPRTLKVLARIALRLLELAPEPIHLRLADSYENHTANVFRDAITVYVGQRDIRRSFSAWVMLLRLLKQGLLKQGGIDADWAITLAHSHWPSVKLDSAELLSVLPLGEVGSNFLAERFAADLQELPLLTIVSRVRRRAHRHDNDVHFFDPALLPQRAAWRMLCTVARDGMLNGFRSDSQRNHVQFKLDGNQRVIINFDYRSVETPPSWTLIAPSAVASQEYRLLHAVGRFNEDPTPTAMQEVIGEAVANTKSDETISYASMLASWPLAAVLQWLARRKRHSKVVDVDSLLMAIANGTLGDRTAWTSAERRWATQGIVSRDLDTEVDSKLPFDYTIAAMGLPPLELGWYFGYHGADTRVTTEIQHTLLGIRNERMRVRLAMRLALADYGPTLDSKLLPLFSVRVLQDLIEEGDWIDVSLCVAATKHCEYALEWVDLLDKLGCARVGYVRNRHGECTSDLLALCRLYPSRLGLRWLAVASLAEGRIPRARAARQFPELPPGVSADSTVEDFVRLVSVPGRSLDVRALGASLANVVMADPNAAWLAVSLSKRLSVNLRVTLLCALREHLLLNGGEVHEILNETVVGIAERRSSGFGNAEFLRHLRLRSDD